MEFSPFLEITPGTSTPVTVPHGTGITLSLDFDIESSIKINVTEAEKLIFRPIGRITRVDDQLYPNGLEARPIHGTVAKIPVATHTLKRFILKQRKSFLYVDVSEATIYRFDGEIAATSSFETLKEDQQVELRGIFTPLGILKAKSVVILPEEQKTFRGVITALNTTSTPPTFELKFFHQQDREATSTEKIIVAYIRDRVHILQPPDRRLTPSDLTNGQRVSVRGIRGENDLRARVIVIEPERFRGFIAEQPQCKTDTEGLIRVTQPFKESGRMELAGIALKQNKTSIVEINNQTRLFGQDNAPLLCRYLERGMAIKIVGRMVPYTPITTLASSEFDANPVRIKADRVKVIPVDHIGGTARSIMLDGEGRRVIQLAVPIDKVEGFDRPVSSVCVASDTPLCNLFMIDLILSEDFYNPDGIKFDPFISQEIKAAGYFMGKPITVGSKGSFFAVLVRKGLPETRSVLLHNQIVDRMK